MQSKAPSIAEYLASLPEERRSALEQVRAVIRKHLPQGYAEQMQYGMISYVVPLALYPAGYLNKQDVPLPFVSLASQKQHMAIYLMNVDGNPELEAWFQAAWRKSQKKLDMGKSCLRFKRVEDLALDVLGEAVARSPIADYISRYELAHKPPAKKTLARGTPARKTPALRSTAQASPARGTPAKKTPARGTSAKKTSARGTSAKKTSARGTPAKKTPARGTSAKKSPALSSTAKKAPARGTPAKKTSALSSTAKKS
jgi:hypothetical protein